MFFKKKDVIQNKKDIVNEDIIKALAPSGVNIGKDHILIDDKYYRFFTIVNYPDSAYLNWLSKLNIKNVTWSYHIKDINVNELIDYYSKSINQKEIQKQQTKNPQVKIQATKDIANMNTMIERMMSDNDKTVDFIVVIRVVANSLYELSEISNTVRAKAQSYKLPIKCILYNQEALYHKNMPLNLDMDLRYSNPMPLGNISVGFPFLNNSINDTKGVLLGKDDNLNNIIVDFNLKSESRFNSNIAVIGDSGSGKTTLTSDIIYQEYLAGVRHFIIDVEREYVELAKKLGGQVIDMSGASVCFNPFEIFLVEDYDLEEGDSQLSSLALHIKHLKKFFSVYDPTIDKHQLSELSIALLEFYKINKMTNDMTLEELKTFEQLYIKDFYAFLLEYKNDKSSFEKEQIEKIISSIKDIAIGVDSYMWNKKSNFSELGDFVVFDIYKLRDMEEALLQTQYFLIITRLWNECIKNREENKNRVENNKKFIRITADELHRIITNLYIAQSFRTLSKMVRKYDTGLLTVSQSTTDYLHKNIEAEGKDILSSSVYKFIYAQNAQGLIDTKTIFNLNPKEVETLEGAYRGDCIAFFGNYRTKMHNEVPDFILDIIRNNKSKL